MATYVIGDVQGCREQLDALLQEISPDPQKDRLWLTGDLVNRGPDSLGVLRWAAAQGDWVQTVLGNHDLWLLACARGLVPQDSYEDLHDVLCAPDRLQLLEWLLHRPLLVRDDSVGVLLHAGLKPTWSVGTAEQLAREAEVQLRADPEPLLEAYADRERPSPSKTPEETLKVLTLTRMVDAQGEPRFSYKGPPGEAAGSLRPWFEERTDNTTLYFGHWAALGLHTTQSAVCVDSGCVWGGSLTAYRVDDGAVFQVPGLSS